MSGSKGARELALKLFTTAPGQYELLPTPEEAAALIDSHLEPLLRAIEAVRRIAGDFPTVEKLVTEAEKWKPGGSEDTAR